MVNEEAENQGDEQTVKQISMLFKVTANKPKALLSTKFVKEVCNNGVKDVTKRDVYRNGSQNYTFLAGIQPQKLFKCSHQAV